MATKFESKYTSQQYRFICELLWGNVPIDRLQAEESGLFKTEAPKILAKYPMLDKSFFETHKNSMYVWN